MKRVLISLALLVVTISSFSQNQKVVPARDTTKSIMDTIYYVQFVSISDFQHLIDVVKSADEKPSILNDYVKTLYNMLRITVIPRVNTDLQPTIDKKPK
jgi:hypothetical protein